MLELLEHAVRDERKLREPFTVKGKALPVQAWPLGGRDGARTRDARPARLPLIGRDAELAQLRARLPTPRAGAGRLIELVGEAGGSARSD